MKNKVYKINYSETNNIIETCKKNMIYLAQLYGENIKTVNDYFNEISRAFDFPKLFDKYRNWDAYLDWIRDLDWITYKSNYVGFALIIYNYDVFMNNDFNMKKKILGDFEDVIFPYWEEEVVFVAASSGGIPRKFNVYLVEN